MSIKCLCCRREYDVTLFEFGRPVACECGHSITLQHEEWFRDVQAIFLKHDIAVEEEKLSQVHRLADKIAFLIVSTDQPSEDIGIEKRRLRELVSRLFPGKEYLCDMIYEPRFMRLWEQFRKS